MRNAPFASPPTPNTIPSTHVESPIENPHPDSISPKSPPAKTTQPTNPQEAETSEQIIPYPPFSDDPSTDR